MTKRKKGKRETDPQRYYAVVEDKIEALEGRNHSRSVLLLDGVDADRFESDDAAIDDPSALSLVRAMTTEHVWDDRHQLGNLTKGDWVEILLDDGGHAPMAWEMRADEEYRRRPKRSVRRIRRLGRPVERDPEPGDRRDLVAGLHAQSNQARGRHRTVPFQSLADRLNANPNGKQDPKFADDICIRIIDVGQASAALILRGDTPLALFDAGAPIWFNKGSVALGFEPPDLGGGFIFLSHWDFDHFDMGRRHTAWHTREWYAPDQTVSPNTALFQKKLGRYLTFVDGPLSVGGFRFERGISPDPLDRNGTGYQLRYENDGHAVLLTGDTDYAYIEASMKAGLSHLCIPHHGGRGTVPPTPVGGTGRSVVSYGLPNAYRHPHVPQIKAHETLGWSVSPTAAETRPRGDRQLYPTPSMVRIRRR
ncbi:hypothetical protein GOL45_16510 [Sinorhizobium medicae]|nr:hypothetical protein [Sinorhizobium medicae]